MITQQCVEMVAPSFGLAPSVSAKVVLLATLSADLVYELPRTLAPLRAPMMGSGSSAALLFDVPLIYMLTLRRVVGEILSSSGLAVRWTDPAKSCSSTEAQDRITIAARYGREALTEAQRLATFSRIRRQLEDKQIFMAKEDIFADATAPLLEATDAEALLALWPLCQEMAMVRPGLATVRSLTADSTWSRCMEELFQASADSFATKLKWRKSYHGGRTIAQPQATARQLALSRRLAGQQLSERRHVAEVSIAGPASCDTEEVAYAIMTIVASKGMVLQEVPSSALTQPDNGSGWQARPLRAPRAGCSYTFGSPSRWCP